MVKFILYITKLIITAAMAMLFASCNFNVDFGRDVSGDGNVVTENRNNDTEFTSVEASRGLDVEIEQSTSKSITVIADQNLQNHISTQIESGVLKITTDVNIKDAESKKIVVKMPVIDVLQASSAATIKGTGLIRANNLGLSASSAGDIDLDFEGESLMAESSSAANIHLSGKALKFDATSSSGSSMDAKKLLANDISAKASSGSGIDVHPLVNLNGRASSGAFIRYHNKPSNNVKKKVSSGGSISEQ